MSRLSSLADRTLAVCRELGREGYMDSMGRRLARGSSVSNFISAHREAPPSDTHKSRPVWYSAPLPQSHMHASTPAARPALRHPTKRGERERESRLLFMDDPVEFCKITGGSSRCEGKVSIV